MVNSGTQLASLSALCLLALAACQEPTGPRERVEIRPDSVSLLQFDTATLSATYFKAAGDSVAGGVRWSSQDTSIARIDELSGVVRGMRPGQTRVTATSRDNPSVWASVKVAVSVHPVSLTRDSIVLGPGRCTADVRASPTTPGYFTASRWEIRDTIVAGVGWRPGGTIGLYRLHADVGARAEGVTSLQVSTDLASGTYTRSIPVRVEALPPARVFFRLSHLLVSLVVGDSVTVGPGVASACGPLEGVPTVRTEHPEIAEVDARFVVRARRVGRTTLTGSFGPAVSSSAIAVQDYFLTPADTTIREGDTVAVRAFWVRDSGTSEMNSVILTSSDTSVARVLNSGSAGSVRYVEARRAGAADLLIGRYRRGQVRVVPR